MFKLNQLSLNVFKDRSKVNLDIKRIMLIKHTFWKIKNKSIIEKIEKIYQILNY